MKAPAFQFYPADWLANVKLRRCSPAARGVWIDVMCLMHGSDEYGVLRWPLAEIAGVVNAPVKILRELADRGVLKGAESGAADYIFTPRHAGKDGEPVVLVTTKAGPCWYSSRFVRDEWVRQRRGANTRFDTDNQPSNGSPTRRVGERQGDPPNNTPSREPSGAPTRRESNGASSSVYNPSTKGKNIALGAQVIEPPAPAGPIEKPATGKPAAPRKVAVNGNGEPPKSGLAWNAYATAYRDRYHVDPVRNAQANALLCKLVDLVGEDDAPQVAAFYVSHNKSWYVEHGHDLGALVKDAPWLRTQWMTGRTVTSGQARQADRTQGQANVWNEIIAEERGKERAINER